jgi:pimeloyl-ACP methyl ester carboxylesterase
MRCISYPAGPRSDTLVVLLPGLKDHARVFADQGFIKALERSGAKADLVAVDAHRGYYTTGSVLRRLHEDVLAQRLAQYKRVVLVGVSMGAYGAIRYTIAHPEKIDTLMLFSPFLGAGPFMRSLAEPGDEDFADTWDWLKNRPHPRVVLGYGHEDAFLLTDRRLAELLPAENVVKVNGGHFWHTWRTALEMMLAPTFSRPIFSFDRPSTAGSEP